MTQLHQTTSDQLKNELNDELFFEHIKSMSMLNDIKGHDSHY